jgi:hypothetical protein
VKEYPLATCLDGCLYYHEFGIDDGSTAPASAIEAFVESSIFDLGEGDRYMFARRIIPDVDFEGSSSGAPTVTMTLTPRNYPGELDRAVSAAAITRSATVPIEQYTREKWIRLRGRHVALKVSSDALGVQWQLGHPRLEVQPDGGRA